MKSPVLLVFGTRPEAIKLAPVIRALNQSSRLRPVICVSAQHRELLDQANRIFDIQPEHDLDLMTDRQPLEHITCGVLTKLQPVLRSVQPKCLIVQGDTTTAFAAALEAFYQGIPVAHVEAGLRSFSKSDPFPEEVNRTLVTHLANYHFAPTERARQNLLREGIGAEKIWVTGNTIVDALKLMRPSAPAAKDGAMNLLVTTHRRESWPKLPSVCEGLRQIASQLPGAVVRICVHPNPTVREVIERELGNLPNIHLLPPQDYDSFLGLLSQADLVLTDSGGVQEEVVSMGKPVVVLREATERPEVIESGFGRLVGTDARKMLDAALYFSSDWSSPTQGSPFGDGMAAERIVKALESELVV